MLYLLDANVLIDANRDYYPIEGVPEFWDWLIYLGFQGQVKIPLEIYEELKKGKDGLAIWAKQAETEEALLLKEDVNINILQTIVKEGYAEDLTDSEMDQIGRDPFLISYAFIDISSRCVVTTEATKPKKQRANRHIPDVCKTFDVSHCHSFQFFRDLHFTTKWKDLL